MNIEKIANRIIESSELPSGLTNNDIFAVASSYYDNSGLDMGQYEESRSVDLYVYVRDENVKGLAVYERRFGRGELETKQLAEEFGHISKANPRAIQSWADTVCGQFRVSNVKRWVDTNKRKSTIKILLEAKKMEMANVIQQSRKEDGMPVVENRFSPSVEELSALRYMRKNLATLVKISAIDDSEAREIQRQIDMYVK